MLRPQTQVGRQRRRACTSLDCRTATGDPSSTQCARTFCLHVWDRVIDGYNSIHRAAYHRSITIML